ncbi:type I-E CRISPR-associated protein Cse2/CasB (plasmid) [Streptomyces sp. BHT-5-2]|uniref:type I-E CRISPR-associated protein Cse2/CasB n=1 Tax=Streptomyces sp. BHT-5-2 TaxID=2866715 RepID=UPI001C8D6D7F|nr:type I-E CRISPR-associated protein Cse2/CasB [Streptomyces sp. BHT-5-2]QZL07260.1 type I-E CRISPR-associated protein Cse2/CasB [Streptomyces sp. BHT-5-2]
MTTTASERRKEGDPPPWHSRLAEQLKKIDRDPALAAACRRGRNTEPLDEIDMHEPITYVLEGDQDTELAQYVPLWQREAVTAAAHHSLALYACHVQSKSVPMHRRGISLGTAARKLQTQMPSKDGASQRFRAALSADSTTELTTHLRFLISLLRTYDIALDYVALTDALATWDQPERRQALVRHWGMDFRRTLPKITPTDSNATDSPKE